MLSPENMPLRPEQIAEHRSKPTLVREYVLGLPEGYSLFYFCSVVLDYPDLDPYVHGSLCHFLEHPQYGRFRDATVPRSFFKTSIATVGKAIWLPIRRDRNIKILIAMNTADNAEKRLHLIRHHWESNKLLKEAFPELVPDFKKVRWSNKCAEIRRTKQSDEGTYESVGSGGAVVSRHFDHIIEDDLVYAKKDDLKGAEIMPNQDDIDKAIGWHKLVYSLFSNPTQSSIDNIGTRWAVHDLKDWIMRNEKSKFKRFIISAEKDDGTPVWPARFGEQALREIRESQGPRMYATQYLNKPRADEDVILQEDWLNYYDSEDEIPQDVQNYTFIDLAGWADSKGHCRNVVLTLAIDANHHIWIRRYDRGKFNPQEVIELMERHHKLYNSKVFPEEVGYQKAISFFAKQRMEQTGYWYSISPLPFDGRANAKDLRIRSIANVASMGGIHIYRNMYDLIREWVDYPNGITCDIIDCIGYGVAQLRKTPLRVATPKQNPFSLEAALESIGKQGQKTQYPISVESPITIGEDDNWYVTEEYNDGF